MLDNENTQMPMVWLAQGPQPVTPVEPYASPVPVSGQEISVYSQPAPGPVASALDEPWQFDAGGLPPVIPPAQTAQGGGRRRRGHMGRYALVVFALLVTLLVGAGIGHATRASTASATKIGASSNPVVSVSTNITSLEQSLTNVASAVTPSVVEIASAASGQEAIGSGDILTTDGYIVTNDHVVDGYTSYTVTLYNGTTLAATLVGTDPQDDLAVIKVTATNLKPVTFADSSQLQVGEFAVAIGTPYGQRETVTFGTVSGLNRTESESPSGPASILTGLVQTSAPIAPGNSGGALVNMQGQLIGIPTLGATSQQTQASGSSTTTVGFAIPSNEVKTVAQQLIQTGRVTTSGKGFLGIQGQDVTPQVASADNLSVQSGVLITGFANDAAGQSPAQASGLQTGDVIVAVNGQPVTDSTDLAGTVASQASGLTVSVTVARGSGQVTEKVTLGQRLANA